MAFDVDGVLGGATIYIVGGQPVRTANVKDGYALQMAVKSGYQMAIFSGGRSEAVEERYKALGFQDVYMACHCKMDVLDQWMAKHNLSPEEIVYMGDDIPDYEVMKRVGCSCCPSDAAHEIKAIATYVSPAEGGQGCARDVIEQILRANDQWMANAEAFEW